MFKISICTSGYHAYTKLNLEGGGDKNFFRLTLNLINKYKINLTQTAETNLLDIILAS